MVYCFGLDDCTERLGIGEVPVASSSTGIRPIPELKLVEAIEIYAGQDHSIVLSNRGDLYTFGTSKDGCLGHGQDTKVLVPRRIRFFLENNIKIIRMTSLICTMAVSAKGDLYSFGNAEGGKLGHGHAPIIAGGPYRQCPGCEHNYLVKNNGEVVFKNELTPKKVEFFSSRGQKILDVSCGLRHSVVMTASGDVFVCGQNPFGSLGI